MFASAMKPSGSSLGVEGAMAANREGEEDSDRRLGKPRADRGALGDAFEGEDEMANARRATDGLAADASRNEGEGRVAEVEARRVDLASADRDASRDEAI